MRDCWCNIIAANVPAPSEHKGDDSNDSFYDDLEQISIIFNTKILLGDFSANVRKENIFKPTIGNENLHQDGNDEGVRIVKFTTSKNVVVRSTMFPHREIHKCT